MLGQFDVFGIAGISVRPSGHFTDLLLNKVLHFFYGLFEFYVSIGNILVNWDFPRNLSISFRFSKISFIELFRAASYNL